MVLLLPEGTLSLDPADALSLAKLMDSVIAHSTDEKEIQKASTYEGLFLSLAWIGAYQYNIPPQNETDAEELIKSMGGDCHVSENDDNHQG